MLQTPRLENLFPQLSAGTKCERRGVTSSEHEAVVRLFAERPELAAELLGESLNVPLPQYDYAGVESGDLTEVTPAELRADAVIVFRRKQHLEKLMKTEHPQYLSERARSFVAEGRAEGEAKGCAKARREVIFDLLEDRGLEVPEDVHAVINACTDLDRLRAWARAARTAPTAQALIDD